MPVLLVTTIKRILHTTSLTAANMSSKISIQVSIPAWIAVGLSALSVAVVSHGFTLIPGDARDPKDAE